VLWLFSHSIWATVIILQYPLCFTFWTWPLPPEASSISRFFFTLSWLETQSRFHASNLRPRDSWFFHMIIWYDVYISDAQPHFTSLLVHRPESRPGAIDVLYMCCDCIAVLNTSVSWLSFLLIYAVIHADARHQGCTICRLLFFFLVYNPFSINNIQSRHVRKQAILPVQIGLSLAKSG